ncbi:MAG: ROK family protein [Anaerolineales bacterium]|nr:ROK family protein [Anaerolineales bacterium]
MPVYYGGLEAGGTKMICAVGAGPNDLVAEARLPTTTPAETLAEVIAFFKAQQAAHGPLAGLGIGTFGPLDLDRASPTYGYITATTKPGWSQVDMAGPLGAALGAPVGFDTDVNAAALGEWRWGAAQGLDTFLYLTIGTGIGGGAVVNGKPLHGLLHPEMGHIRIPHDRQADPFAGVCAFHGDCLEGLASGPAIGARWSQPAEQLPPDHPAWALEAQYLGAGVASLICALSPQRVILGGGVMSQAHLFPLVRAEVRRLLNGYVQLPAILTGAIDGYIVPPGLGGRAGVLGAIALGELAAAG